MVVSPQRDPVDSATSCCSRGSGETSLAREARSFKTLKRFLRFSGLSADHEGNLRSFDISNLKFIISKLHGLLKIYLQNYKHYIATFNVDGRNLSFQLSSFALPGTGLASSSEIFRKNFVYLIHNLVGFT